MNTTTATETTSTTTIRYAAVVDCELTSGYWTGDRAEALARGRAAVSARQESYQTERYTYRADETGSHIEVTGDELARLGAALLDGRTMGEAYSVWCTESGHEAHARDM